MSKTFNAKKYDNTWDTFRHISWNLYEPLSKVKRFDHESEKFVDASDLMNLKVPIKKGDQIAIIEDQIVIMKDQVAITEDQILKNIDLSANGQVIEKAGIIQTNGSIPENHNPGL